MHSFSYLPILIEKDGKSQWHLLSDSAIATYLRQAHSNNDRKARLACTIEKARGLKDKPLDVKLAEICSYEDEINDDLLKLLNQGPLLVIEKRKTEEGGVEREVEELLGIVTAFDLL